MRYLALLVLLFITFSCAQKTQEKTQTDKPSIKPEPIEAAQTYQYDSIKIVYPTNWLLKEDIDDSGSNLISIKPKNTLSTGVISVAIFKAELPILNTLLSMKGSVYLSLDIEPDAIIEDKAKEITYQGVTALFQTYQADLGKSKVSGQFIVLNKSGRCYVLFFQSKEDDKKATVQIFDAFEKQLEIR